MSYDIQKRDRDRRIGWAKLDALVRAVDASVAHQRQALKELERVLSELRGLLVQ